MFLYIMYRKYKNVGDNVYIKLKMTCHKYYIYFIIYTWVIVKNTP